MKSLAQLWPNTIYVNQVLEPFKKSEDKFNGLHFSLISTREEFLEEFLLFKTFSYNIRLIRAYYSNKYYKLPLMGVNASKKITDQRLDIKAVKSLKTNKYIKVYPTVLEKSKGLNIIQNFRHELNTLYSDISSPQVHSDRTYKTFKQFSEVAKEVGYQEKILIIDGEDIRNENLMESIKYQTFLKKNPEMWNLFSKIFVVFPKHSAFTLLSPELKFKAKFQKVIEYIKANEIPEDSEDVIYDKDDKESEEDSGEEVKKTSPLVMTATNKIVSKEADAKISVKEEKEFTNTESLKNEVKDEYLIQTGKLPGDYNSLPSEVEKLIDAEVSRLRDELIKNNVATTLVPKNLDKAKIEKQKANSIKAAVLQSKSITDKIQEFKEVEHKQKVIEQKIQEHQKTQEDLALNFPNIPSTTLKEFIKPVDQVLKPSAIKEKSILNEEVKVSKLKAASSAYQKELMEKDIVKIFSCFSNDSSNPLFLKKLEKIDSSDAFNKIWTYKATYAETSGKQFTFTIQMPKITDEGYIFLNGSKKVISKQFLSKPVIKRKPDEVQVTSFYNKTFIQRNGQKSSSLIEKLKKYFADPKKGKGGSKITVIRGNNTKANKSFATSVLFNDLSSEFTEITVDLGGQSNKITIMFNLEDAETKAIDTTNSTCNKIFKRFPNAYIFAFEKDGLYFADKGDIYFVTKDQLKESKAELAVEKYKYSSIIDFILSKIREASSEVFDELIRIATGKRFVYSSARILRKNVPISILLSFKDGLENFLKQLDTDYTFYPTNKVITKEERIAYASIRFKNGTLIYNNSDLKTQLLMNGFSLMDTSEYDYSDFNTPTPYLDYFDSAYSTRNIGKGFRNFWERFIDPVTLELLAKDSIPTDFSGLLIYCSGLLEDNAVKDAVDVSNFRIRSTEMVTQALYQVISNAFNTYKTDYINTGGSAGVKMSSKETAVLDKVIESQNVESVTLLSPITEVSGQQKCTFKGLGGINLDDSFTNAYRRFDESMKGVFSLFGPYSAEAGISRNLSYNTKISDMRGFIDNNPDERCKPTELISVVEGINPFTIQHSDFPRIAMSGGQQGHTTPSHKQSKPLVGNGIHKTIAHIIGNDFSFKAKKDGKIESIDGKTHTITIKYDDGTMGVIDTKPRLVKNTSGGFYIKTQLTPYSKIKVGTKVKAEEILAYDKDYFKPSSSMFGGEQSLEYASGYLVKSALCSDSNTFEDSVIVTDDLSEALAFDVVADKSVVLGVNANIVKIAKIGDKIKSGEPLIIFEASFQEDKINEVIRRLGQDMGEEALELGRRMVKSKFTGEVVDIKMFYNHPKEEFSASIQKVIDSYISENKKREGIVTKTKTDDILDIANTDPVNYTKLFGQDFDGIYIEFYVSHEDTLNQGDKLSAQVAIKGTVGDVIKKEQAPTSEYTPNKHIQLLVSPISVVGRMTTDYLSVLYCNKAIIGLKERCEEIWNE